MITCLFIKKYGLFLMQ